MHKGKRGVLFVFSGPSGVGKGTLKAKLFEEFADRIAYSVSATTRGPREGEVDGKDYFFISLDINFRGTLVGDQPAIHLVNRDGERHVLLVLGVDERRNAVDELTGALARFNNQRIAAIRLFKKLQNRRIGHRHIGFSSSKISP